MCHTSISIWILITVFIFLQLIEDMAYLVKKKVINIDEYVTITKKRFQEFLRRQLRKLEIGHQNAAENIFHSDGTFIQWPRSPSSGLNLAKMALRQPNVSLTLRFAELEKLPECLLL